MQLKTKVSLRRGSRPRWSSLMWAVAMSSSLAAWMLSGHIVIVAAQALYGCIHVHTVGSVGALLGHLPIISHAGCGHIVVAVQGLHDHVIVTVRRLWTCHCHCRPHGCSWSVLLSLCGGCMAVYYTLPCTGCVSTSLVLRRALLCHLRGGCEAHL